MASPGKNEELRFADALAELSAVVELAEDHRDGSPAAAAGVRVERLLGSLRAQFLRDLGGARLGRAGAD